MKKILLFLFFLSFSFSQNLFSQSTNFWKVKGENDQRLIQDRKSSVKKFKSVELDFNLLKQALQSATSRETSNQVQTVLVLFPLENGKFENFEIEKTNVLHPDLEANYPEIQSFYGVSKQNALNKIYISISPEGFTGLITGEKTIYIDPVSKGNTTHYIVYDRTDCERSATDPFVCHADNNEFQTISKSIFTPVINNTTDGKLRTYKIAIACTSEYSAYYGNTIAEVLAAMNTTITRVNSIYIRDLAVRFQIVADNNKLIYINGQNSVGSSDPYDNYNGSQMLNANTGNINGIIGTANYNIGHVFSTGGGGIASTSPCNSTSKGNGVTGIVTPQFDPFDIDYVCHEIGHQFGAGHTYYNDCFGAKVADDYEPGSASTIMGYAGICAPNVQSNSDAYFHARSLEQMTAQIASHSCETEVSHTNTEPIANAGGNYTIPKSTPFILNGSGSSDLDSADVLTYCWEQYNNDGAFTQPPVATNTGGPVFRSLTPTVDPYRTFPNLNAIINNQTPTWEVLPSVARTLNFRLTVRDNNSNAPQTNSANAIINVGTAGPFVVTSPNSSVVWYAGETKAITWNVAGTNSATYSQNVNIKLSTDGGFTYPITLANAVPNSGTTNIVVPNAIGKNNRIKVEAAGNIFFDISNTNFEIKSNKYDLTLAQSSVSVCKPANAIYTIAYAPAPSFSETVTFSTVGLPSGATATFSPSTRNAAGNVTLTVSGLSTVAIGTYNFDIKGTSATSSITTNAVLKSFDNTIGTATLTSPTNGAQNQQTSVLLQWNAINNASSYIVEIATNPNFSAIVETATVTENSYQTTSLAAGTINYWRIKPINSCVTGANSEVFSFQIAQDTCKTYSNVSFEGNAIWESNSTNAVIAKMNVIDDILISKVTFNLKAKHPFATDLKMQFSSPTGLFIEVYNRDCSGANFDVTFDDAGTDLVCGTNPALGGIQKANQPLSRFINSNAQGVWTFLATDRVANNHGTVATTSVLNAFSITICGKLQTVNDITIAKNTLNITQGNSAIIPQTLLASSQANATTSQLKYTITQLPLNGNLKRNNVLMAVGSTFTQADINSNLITYTNNNSANNSDNFKFAVTGNNVAFIGGQVFNIQVCTTPIPTIASLPVINGQCSVTPVAPTATSNCNGTITAITATSFPITTPGTTSIIWIYNDGNGGISTQTQNVIILDTTPPVVPTLPAITNQCFVTLTAPTTTDNCAGTLTGTTNTVFPITTLGTTIVTWTFNDGNQSVTANQSVTINGTTWNGISWSNNAPNANLAAIISGNFTATQDLVACSLLITNNAQVTVNSGVDFTISGDVTINSGSTLTFQNNSNLLQTKNTNGNTGNAIVKRQTSAIMRQDYNLWSSPTAGQGLLTFSPETLTNRFYTYNSATNLYNMVVSPATTNFDLAKGYLIRVSNNHPTSPTIWEGQFNGVLNNGNYTIPVNNSSYNAIGNPYPSTISANSFINTNNINEALYFWRKTNNSLTTSYATYTLAGGTANGEVNNIVPNGIIQVGQGFIIKATSGAVNFNNMMRTGNNANQFLRIYDEEKHRIWLNLSHDNMPINQMMIAYMTDATEGIDNKIDGRFINDNQTALNSLINGEEFVIQGRSLPFLESDIVPLAFKTDMTGNFSISIDHVDGLFESGQSIYIKDNVTNSTHKLNDGAYQFTSSAGIHNNRFDVVYSYNALENPNFNFETNNIIVYTKDKGIAINSSILPLKNVKIYDIRGRFLYEEKEIKTNSVFIQDIGFAKQALILQITTEDNKITYKKVIY